MYLRSLGNTLKASRVPQRLNIVCTNLPASCLRSQSRAIAFRASPFHRNEYTLPHGTGASSAGPGPVNSKRNWTKILGGFVGFFVGAFVISNFAAEDEKHDNELAEQFVAVLRKATRGDRLTDSELAVVDDIIGLETDIPSVKTLILAGRLLAVAYANDYVQSTPSKVVVRKLLDWAGNDEEEEIALRLTRLQFPEAYSRAELANDLEYLEGVESLSSKDLAAVGFGNLALGKNKQARAQLARANHPAAAVVPKQNYLLNLPPVTFKDVHVKSNSKQVAVHNVVLSRSFNFCSLRLPSAVGSLVGLPTGLTLEGYSTPHEAWLYNIQTSGGETVVSQLHLNAFDAHSWSGTWTVKRAEKGAKLEDAAVVSTAEIVLQA